MANNNFELRALTFIDSLQPQLVEYMTGKKRIKTPNQYDAALLLEISPALEIHGLIDTALKATEVDLGVAITERRFGLMQIQHQDQGEVKEAGRAVLRSLGLDETSRTTATLLTYKIIRSVEQDHTEMFNKKAKDEKVIAGESVLILEATPAAYLAIAANEALKAANVKLIRLKSFGATGRLIMSGIESEIDSAADAAIAILKQLNSKAVRQLD
ncbi:MAG: BMC domain-containing protein [Gammaproteobacteria bacterium]|nr:BMC domain-containing protein [Gammaproteobacteria bacterium]